MSILSIESNIFFILCFSMRNHQHQVCYYISASFASELNWSWTPATGPWWMSTSRNMRWTNVMSHLQKATSIAWGPEYRVVENIVHGLHIWCCDHRYWNWSLSICIYFSHFCLPNGFDWIGCLVCLTIFNVSITYLYLKISINYSMVWYFFVMFISLFTADLE